VGTGSVVVGLGSPWSRRVLLRRSFRIYLPDARGHAGTRWDASASLDREVLIDDLAAFVDALGLTTFHLAARPGPVRPGRPPRHIPPTEFGRPAITPRGRGLVLRS